jgi:hypothetical protein
MAWNRNVLRLCLALTLPLLVACQGLGVGGSTLATDTLIPLSPGGPHSGQWSSSDCSVAYRYSFEPKGGGTGGVLTLSGDVTYAYTHKLDSLSILLWSADMQGNALSRTIVFNSGFRVWIPGSRFERRLEVPAGAQAISFQSDVTFKDARK